MNHYDVIVIGAGASGLMCAATASYRGKSVLLLEHTHRIGRKILMSGGGRCNFTNLHNTAANFISDNPHFCKSALSRYSVQNFIDLVERHGVEYHEKTLGQLFCNESSKEMLRVLTTECEWAGVNVLTEVKVNQIQASPREQQPDSVTEAKNSPTRYQLHTSAGKYSTHSLVVATGGLSIPTGGASPFAYQVAEQFGLSVLPTSAALVPVTLQKELLDQIKPLSGVSHWVKVSCGGMSFTENLLFTHRGLSGPAILQISSYWSPGEAIHINFCPDLDVLEHLKSQRQQRPKADVASVLAELMSKRMAQTLCEIFGVTGKMADQSNDALEKLAEQLQNWSVKPSGTEGYRTAEVTLGGIDTQGVNQKTMEANNAAGLYFIGECLDVTGHLGGHNFQWAWASGFAAGQAV